MATQHGLGLVYSTPQLEYYGTLADLTAAGSGLNQEGTFAAGSGLGMVLPGAAGSGGGGGGGGGQSLNRQRA